MKCVSPCRVRPEFGAVAWAHGDRWSSCSWRPGVAHPKAERLVRCLTRKGFRIPPVPGPGPLALSCPVADGRGHWGSGVTGPES